MARDNVRITIPVVPKLEERGTATFWKEIRDLEKNLKKIDVGFKKTSTTAAQNIRQIKNMSKAAQNFERQLSTGTKDVLTQLGSLSRKIEREQKKASKAKAGAESAESEEEKQKFEAELADSIAMMAKYNKQVDDLAKAKKKELSTVKEISKAQTDYLKGLRYSGKELKSDLKNAGKNLLSGTGSGLISGVSSLFKTGMKGARSIGGAYLEKKIEKGEGGDAKSLAVKGLVGTVGAIGGLVGALSAFMEMLKKASDHMSMLNKALIDGTGLANDFGQSAEQYRKNVDDLRNATINAAGDLLRFGMNSEKAMGAINAFGKAATGSISQTKRMIQQLGGGDLQKGVEQFSKTAIVYGKALGMEANDVAKMMGDFVSDIGYSHENVIGVMGDIVKTAATANIPVHKMMDVFRDVIPNVDLFTNRMEQLTGTIKLLSKTMDPKAMKNFMQSMGKGFDQLDFRQRLKMALVIGPAKVGKILEKDFTASGEAIGKEFGTLGSEVQSALKAADPVKAMAEVAAKATAMGVTPSAIGQAQELARNMASLKKGNVLDTATAMRGAGMYARMSMLEEYAGKFTGGDLSGIGEHVAKQLGVSESEYKSILALRDNMAMYQASIAKTGKTSSKSMNANLIKAYKLSKAGTKEAQQSDEEIEKRLQEMAQSSDNKPLQELLKQAGSMQISDSQAQKESLEDMAVEQYNITASISDKMESVVGYFLEKIFSTLQPMLSVLNDFFDAVTGDQSKKADAIKHKQEMAFQADAAKTAEMNQKNLLNANTTLNEQQKKQASSSLAGMTALIKSTSSTADWMDDASSGKSGLGTQLKPILDQVGKMSVEQFELQQKQFGGQVFRGDPEQDKRFKDILVKIEEAKKSGDMKKVGELQAQATKTASESLAWIKDQEGGRVKMMNTLGSLASGIAVSGGGVGSIGEVNAMVSNRKMTDAQKKAADIVSERGDLDQDFAKKIFAGTNLTVPAAAAAVSSTAPAAVPAAAAKLGVSASEYEDIKNLKGPLQPSPAGGPVELPPVVIENLDPDAEAKRADMQYEAMSDTLSLLKKGTRMEQTWFNTKYIKGMTEAVEKGVTRPLTDHALLMARMWDDPTFRKQLVGWDESSPDWRDQVYKFGMGGLSGVGWSESAKLGEVVRTANAAGASYADGGNITKDGLAYVHAGETVLPKGGGAGKVVTMNVVINARTDATPQQIADALHGLMNRQ